MYITMYHGAMEYQERRLSLSSFTCPLLEETMSNMLSPTPATTVQEFKGFVATTLDAIRLVMAAR